MPDVARHLTEPRRVVLGILAEYGPLDEAGIAQAWRAMRPDMQARHASELPRMIRHLLWRLEILELVDSEHGRYRISSLGRAIIADRGIRSAAATQAKSSAG